MHIIQQERTPEFLANRIGNAVTDPRSFWGEPRSPSCS